MIDELRIGPITYEVTFAISAQLEYLKQDEKEEVPPPGESQPDQCRMVVNRDYHAQQQVVTLFHEIFHIVLQQAGRFYESGDEELVSVLAHGLSQVLRDNPAAYSIGPGVAQMTLDIILTTGICLS